MMIFIYSPEGVDGLVECELDGQSQVSFAANLMKTSSLCRWEIVAQVLKLVGQMTNLRNTCQTCCALLCS